MRAALLLACLPWGDPALGQGTRSPGDSGSVRAFLDRHWQQPISPQGPAPARFSVIEKALNPESCGACHPTQLADWMTSLHSRSMGPGLTGQLAEMTRSDPESARLCLSCHAPLAEQQPEVPGGGGLDKHPAFDLGLPRQGLVCAACHVRKHERFGPPRRDGSLGSDAPRGSLPHNGVTRTVAFLRSEFCSSCHQFSADGFALNGKLLENTYEEWKASSAARRGVQCQDCHMPDRRHLWRGIHDPEMVKSGVEISLETDQARYRPGESVQATLTIKSTNVGHYFPTYVTPKVLARVRLVDAAGRTVPRSAEERAIGRDVTLDLSREIADTRIRPGGRWTFPYRRRLDRPGLRLAITVTVLPDEFYTRFFESRLVSGAGVGTHDIREALAATRRSPFEIFNREIQLT